MKTTSVKTNIRPRFFASLFVASLLVGLCAAGLGASDALAQVWSPEAACIPCADGQTYRLVYQTVYDQKQMTAYRTQYETVYDQKQVTTCRPGLGDPSPRAALSSSQAYHRDIVA